MTSIQVTERLAFPVEAMWALIGDFGGIHRWHPQVCRLDLSWQGRIRTLHYTSGARVVERLEARNDRAHRYAYVMVDGWRQVQACRSTLQARADGEHCLVTWSCEFDAVGAHGIRVEAEMREFFRSGLDALAGALGDA